MNLSSLFGFGIAVWVIHAGVLKHAANPEIFLDPHALILVVGGTAAAGLIAFPARRFLGLIFLMIYGVIFKGHRDHRELVKELITASIVANNSPQQLAARSATHPFLMEGYRLLAENILTEQEFEDVLRKRIHYFKKSYTEDAKMLTALSKFPPAFGLLGATTGMIAMMTGLGKGGQDTIGPAMAIALVATFWGIAVANLLLLPLADYATKVTTEDQDTRAIILEGLLLLRKQATPDQMAEILNSHLRITERVKVVHKGQTGNTKDTSKAA